LQLPDRLMNGYGPQVDQEVLNWNILGFLHAFIKENNIVDDQAFNICIWYFIILN
jgi:hypothetical protein